ncbi:MAG: hypothetical protein LUE92_06105 [Clostridiales bacterium]|nr:hypothetical protein [Clostridiales bacterium]
MKLFLSEMASTPEPESQEHESVLAQLQQKTAGTKIGNKTWRNPVRQQRKRKWKSEMAERFFYKTATPAGFREGKIHECI